MLCVLFDDIWAYCHADSSGEFIVDQIENDIHVIKAQLQTAKSSL